MRTLAIVVLAIWLVGWAGPLQATDAPIGETSQGIFPTSIDTDNDGIDDEADADDDGDNVADSIDAFPLDSRYSADSDNDGLPDPWETSNGLDPDNGNDATSDLDNDELTALEEFGYGTSANRTDSDLDTLPDGWEIANGRDPLVADYQVSAGYYYTCAVDDAGVQCWGYNDDGLTSVPALSNPVC